MHTFAPKGNQQPVTSRLVPVTKLAVSSPGDLHEQEAERLAERVTRLSGPLTQPATRTAPASGAALSDELRSYFEPRFGHDFSRVRVHTDARAARSAHALGAQAYTLGNDMVLGAGTVCAAHRRRQAVAGTRTGARRAAG
jgi:hypothetical protein